MKNRISIVLISSTIFMSSCLTGGFDDNEQLNEHEAALAKAPKVESILVNGEEVERNSVSLRVVEATIGEELNITAKLSSGKGAELVEMEFFRIYYYHEDFQESAKPVDLSTDGFYDLSGNTYDFNYTYTVPLEDDDGYEFEPGYIIQVYFRVKNSLDNFGFKSFEIHLVE